MANFTPLRYPGGKAKLSWLLKSILDENRLCDGAYVEPYAGGSGLALELLFTGFVSTIYLNDLNPGVFAFWKSAVTNAEALCRKISNARITVQAWKRHKSIVDNPKENSMLDLAFAFLFLNRTNRSGIIGAGMIGGYEQNNVWKIDARFNKKTLIERIELIASHSSRITISNEDALYFIEKIDRDLPDKSFIYLDPPYFVQGKRLYDNFYSLQDHKNIANLVSRLKTPWMVSYDDVPEIRSMYNNFRQSTQELRYSAQRVYKGSEVIVFADRLKIPKFIEVTDSRIRSVPNLIAKRSA